MQTEQFVMCVNSQLPDVGMLMKRETKIENNEKKIIYKPNAHTNDAGEPRAATMKNDYFIWNKEQKDNSTQPNM